MRKRNEALSRISRKLEDLSRVYHACIPHLVEHRHALKSLQGTSRVSPVSARRLVPLKASPPLGPLRQPPAPPLSIETTELSRGPARGLY